jgi:hypothetical protein
VVLSAHPKLVNTHYLLPLLLTLLYCLVNHSDYYYCSLSEHITTKLSGLNSQGL